MLHTVPYKVELTRKIEISVLLDDFNKEIDEIKTKKRQQSVEQIQIENNIVVDGEGIQAKAIDWMRTRDITVVGHGEQMTNVLQSLS